jgi:hypothetical protein
MAARLRRDEARRIDLVHLNLEPITVTRHSGDHALPQQLAQRGDLHLQVVLLHHQPGPDEVEQFVLGDDTAATLDERDQEVEGRGCRRRRAFLRR